MRLLPSFPCGCRLSRMSQNTILDEVFGQFVKRLREAGKLDAAAVDRLQARLTARELKADQIRKALFPEEQLP